MKRNYYHVSIAKDGLTPDQGEYHAEMQARRRKKKVETGQWFVKRVGQTPKRWSYRVKFESTSI
jgi:hypothetical protein